MPTERSKERKGHIGKEIKIKGFSVLIEKDSYQTFKEGIISKVSITRSFAENIKTEVEYLELAECLPPEVISISVEEAKKLIDSWNTYSNQ